MTTEEIQDNYEFKVIRRVLKKEFPYIKDMVLTHDWDNYRSLLFVKLKIDLIELMKSLNIPINTQTTKYISWGGENGYPYLSMFFPPNINQEYDMYEHGKSISKVIARVQKSPSIPHDMKLPRDISVSTYANVGQVDIPKETSPQDSVNK